jgi:hypothetical protein
MYLKLSLVLPSIVIVLLGRPFQGFINLVLFLSAIYSLAFVNLEQGLALYLLSVIHCMILVYIERKSKFTTLFNQLADKIINE